MTGPRSLLVALLYLVTGLTARGNVSLKNGNFFIGYTDIVYPGGFEPKMERVYNSKTSYNGIYGYGWGTEFEVYLQVSPEGFVIVHEFGGGAENAFFPTDKQGQSRGEKLIAEAAEQLVRVAENERRLTDEHSLAEYRRRLREDASYRNQEWIEALKLGAVRSRVIANGTVLRSSRFSEQSVVRERDGYTRYFDNGRIEEFSLEGRLVRVKDRNNNFIRLTYDSAGQLESLVDNFGRRMTFAFNEQGRLIEISGDGGRSAEFRYNSNEELVYSRDVDNNVYEFAYSQDGRHNLVKISYTDGTSMEMDYHGRELNESIKSVKDRDGTLTEYSYKFFEDDRGHYSVSVNVSDSNRKSLSKSSYEYFMRVNSLGSEWMWKMITVLDGDRTETEYDEFSGQAKAINRGDDSTKFKYDEHGHVLHKESGDEITDLKYDPLVGKVSEVVKYSKAKPSRKTWSRFTYDSHGNLRTAASSGGKTLSLTYDDFGRIDQIQDEKTKDRLAFKYNSNSKPVEIRSIHADGTEAAITVTYTRGDEIEKVESTAGRKVALEVTTQFQDLLDVIRPAGVNIGF